MGVHIDAAALGARRVKNDVDLEIRRSGARTRTHHCAGALSTDPAADLAVETIAGEQSKRAL
jgi:hypothetical protein